MSQIFICYRREDSEDIAGRIHDWLTRHFRTENVFLDVDTIQSGDNFPEIIDKEIRECQVFLAIIGKDWLSLKRGDKPRIQDPGDYVRLEIEAALKHGAHLIPVIVRQGRMPLLNELPESLHPLHFKQSINVRSDRTFIQDINELIQNIEQNYFEPLPPLNPLSFEVVNLDSQGNFFYQETKSTNSFIENLGNGVNVEMIQLPAGNFLMGTSQTDTQKRRNERPQHWVQVPHFCMSRYTITQAEWRRVADMHQVDQPLDPNPSHFVGDSRPVEQVSWYDAVEFCKRLRQQTQRQYRLPLEAEWEYACRAGRSSAFSFGDGIHTEYANYDGSPYLHGRDGERRGETLPVNALRFANPFGLSQMHGNVDEWCLDRWSDHYHDAPTEIAAMDRTAWLTDYDNQKRVLRGGSWVCAPWWSRSAARLCDFPGKRLNNIGFRVVLDLVDG